MSLQSANEYFDKNEHQDAINMYTKILPSLDIASTVFSLGQIAICYSNLGDTTKCIEYFEKIIEIKNDIPDVYKNLCYIYVNKRMYDKAIKYAIERLQFESSDNVYHSLADLYFYTKQYEKSLYFYQKMTQNDCVKYSISFVYLALKQFDKGFKLYESRLKSNDICHQTKKIKRLYIPSIPMWNGEQCDKLLVIHEQGIGDNILYFRFLIELAYKYPNTNITFFVKSSLASLFESPAPNLFIRSDSSPFNIQHFEFKIYIMSIPYYLEIKKPYPNSIDYIKTNDTLLDSWKQKLGFSSKPKIGFFYKGLLHSFIEKNIDLCMFKEIADLDIELICLHKKDEIIDDLNGIDYLPV